MTNVFPVNRHHDGLEIAELRNFKINPVATDPVNPVEGILYWVIDVQKWKYWLGTELKVFGLEGGRKRGNFDASAGVIPTAADATNDPGVDLADGDYFIITVAGTIAGLKEEELEVGDLLYANVDAPTAAADFYAVQTNIKLQDKPVGAEELLAVDISSTDPNDFTPTKFDALTGIEIEDSTGLRITDSVSIVYVTDPATNLYVSASVFSLSDITGAKVTLSGYES